MSSRRIAFFGNCQAAALAQLYQRHVAPLTGDSVSAVDIQNKDTDPELIKHTVQTADHVVLQKFDFAPLLTREDLRPGTKYSLFPMMLGTFYWPYGLQDHPRNKPEPFLPAGPYSGQLGDRFLNKLILAGVDPDEAVQRYLDLDIGRIANLDRVLELNIERQKVRDGDTGYAVHKIIETSYRDEYLFIVPGHPTLRLFSIVARQCYFDLGLPEKMIDDVLNAQFKTPFPRFVNPIHPGVIRHFGLTFVTPETRYEHLEDGMFTFAEFARRYMRYEWNAELREAMSGTLPAAESLEMLERALVRSPGSFRGWVSKAGLLLGARRPGEAKAAAQRAVAVDPHHPMGFITLAKACAALGELDEAEAAARRAVTDCRPMPQSQRALGDALDALGRNAEAEDAYRSAIRLLPSDWHYHVSLGNMQLRRRDLAAAEQTYRDAMAAGPGAVPPRRGLAEALARQGRRDEAIAVLREIVADGKADTRTWTRLADLLLAAGEAAVAEAALREAVAAHPSDPSVVLALAEALERQGRRDEAVALLRAASEPGAAPELARHANLHSRLGNLLMRTADPAGAEAAFRRAIEHAQDPAGVQANLAEALEHQGRRQDAIGVLRELVASGQADARAQARLANFLISTGRAAEAEGLLRNAIALDPSTHAYQDQLADTVERQGRLPEAIDLLRGRIEGRGGDASVRVRLANLLLRQGNAVAAEAEFGAALRLDPGSVAAHRGLAGALDAQKRTDEAIAALRRAVASGARDPQMQGRLGNYLLRAGDPGGAETAFRAALEGERSENFRINLAEALRAQQKPREAAEALRPLLRNGRAGDARLHFRLGRLLQEANDLDGAEQAYRAAVAADPGSAGSQAALAGILRRRGAGRRAVG